MSKIAIIGTGISGMGASWLLHKNHDITLYEKASEIGGHTRTRVVQYGDKSIPVDTGFIVFNHSNYPNLCALFRHLDVPTQKSNMTFSISVNDGKIQWGARSVNAVFGQRKNILSLKFWRLIADVLRFNAGALAVAERHPEITLGELLSKLKLGQWFSHYYILPIGGAIWSCSLETMLAFPALTFVRFFKEHGLLQIIGQPQWYTVTGGSIEYVKRLTAPFKDRIRTESGVVSVTRSGGKTTVTDAKGNTEEYDHVVFACHGDQALHILKDPTSEEQAALGAFRYQKNVAFLHKDESVMPKLKRCWSSWVYHYEDSDKRNVIPVTYWMNLLQGIDQHYPLFVTLNPVKPIAKEHIFDEHVFEHPVYSQDAEHARAQLALMQGRQNTWFCGAHLRNGFHEDGLASAVTVANLLGVKAPWQ